MKKKHKSKSYSFKTDQRVPIEWLLIITYRTGVIREIIIPVIMESDFTCDLRAKIKMWKESHI